MIKEIESNQTEKQYQVFNEVQLDTLEGQTITVLQPSPIKYTISRLESQINMITTQVEAMTAEKVKLESILDEITNLEK